MPANKKHLESSNEDIDDAFMGRKLKTTIRRSTRNITKKKPKKNGSRTKTLLDMFSKEEESSREDCVSPNSSQCSNVESSGPVEGLSVQQVDDFSVGCGEAELVSSVPELAAEPVESESKTKANTKSDNDKVKTKVASSNGESSECQTAVTRSKSDGNESKSKFASPKKDSNDSKTKGASSKSDSNEAKTKVSSSKSEISESKTKETRSKSDNIEFKTAEAASELKDSVASSKDSSTHQELPKEAVEGPSGSVKNGENSEYFPNSSLLCPLCWKKFDKSTAHVSHMKICARKKNLTTQQLLEAIELQKKQGEERRLLGLSQVPSVPKKTAPKKKTPTNMPSVNNYQMDLAVAMSRSLEDALPSTSTKKPTLELFGFTTSAQLRNGSPGKKGKEKRNVPTALKNRTQTERERIVTEKASIILLEDDLTVSSRLDDQEDSVSQSATIESCRADVPKLWEYANEQAGIPWYTQQLKGVIENPEEPQESSTNISVGENMPEASDQSNIIASSTDTPDRDKKLHNQRTESSSNLNVFIINGEQNITTASALTQSQNFNDADKICTVIIEEYRTMASFSNQPGNRKEQPVSSSDHMDEQNITTTCVIKHIANNDRSKTTMTSSQQEGKNESKAPDKTQPNQNNSTEDLFPGTAGPSLIADTQPASAVVQYKKDNKVAKTGNNMSLTQDVSNMAANVSRDWKQMINNAAMSDDVIKTKDRYMVYIHQIVFHARYPYILTRNYKSVFIKFNYEVVLMFLEFVYCGSCESFQPRSHRDLKELAKLLKVDELVEYIDAISVSIVDQSVSMVTKYNSLCVPGTSRDTAECDRNSDIDVVFDSDVDPVVEDSDLEVSLIDPPPRTQRMLEPQSEMIDITQSSNSDCDIPNTNDKSDSEESGMDKVYWSIRQQQKRQEEYEIQRRREEERENLEDAEEMKRIEILLQKRDEENQRRRDSMEADDDWNSSCRNEIMNFNEEFQFHDEDEDYIPSSVALNSELQQELVYIGSDSEESVKVIGSTFDRSSDEENEAEEDHEAVEDDEITLIEDTEQVGGFVEETCDKVQNTFVDETKVLSQSASTSRQIHLVDESVDTDETVNESQDNKLTVQDDCKIITNTANGEKGRNSNAPSHRDVNNLETKRTISTTDVSEVELDDVVNTPPSNPVLIKRDVDLDNSPPSTVLPRSDANGLTNTLPFNPVLIKRDVDLDNPQPSAVSETDVNDVTNTPPANALLIKRDVDVDSPQPSAVSETDVNDVKHTPPANALLVKRDVEIDSPPLAPKDGSDDLDKSPSFNVNLSPNGANDYGYMFCPPEVDFYEGYNDQSYTSPGNESYQASESLLSRAYSRDLKPNSTVTEVTSTVSAEIPLDSQRKDFTGSEYMTESLGFMDTMAVSGSSQPCTLSGVKLSTPRGGAPTKTTKVQKSEAIVGALLSDSVVRELGDSLQLCDSPPIHHSAPANSSTPLHGDEASTTPMSVLDYTTRVTPMADYSAMDDNLLKQHLGKYGLKKSLSKNKAKKILKHIYEELHPVIDTKTGKVIEQLPTTAKSGKQQKRKSNSQPESVRPTKRKGSVKTSDAVKVGQKDKKMAASATSVMATSVQELNLLGGGGLKLRAGTVAGCESSIESSLPNIGNGAAHVEHDSDFIRNTEYWEVPEELDKSFDSIGRSSVSEGYTDDDDDICSTQSTATLPIIFRNFIKANTSFYQKVLLYEPIWLEQLQRQLLEFGNKKFKLNDVMDLLDKQCITFRSESQAKNNQRRNMKRTQSSPGKSPKRKK